MITLDLPPTMEQAISQQAQQAGVSMEHYLFQHISALIKSTQSSYDVLMNLDYPDEVAEIDDEPFLRQTHQRTSELD